MSATLLVLLLVQSSSSSSLERISFTQTLNASSLLMTSSSNVPSAKPGPGGGFGGGEPPLPFPLSSAMIQQVRLKDTVWCDSRQAGARQLWDAMYKDTTGNSNLLNYLNSIEERTQSECSQRSLDWFFSLYLDGLLQAGSLHSTLTLGLDSLESPSYARQERNTVASYAGRAAYRLERYALAESLYAVALEHQRLRGGEDSTRMAMMLTNQGWARLRLGQEQEAECGFHEAQLMLSARCGTVRPCKSNKVEEFLSEAERGAFVAKGSLLKCLGRAIEVPGWLLWMALAVGFLLSFIILTNRRNS